MPDQLLLTEAEAMKVLRLDRMTLYTLRKAGQIPYLRLGRSVRYSPEALRAWIHAKEGEHGRA